MRKRLDLNANIFTEYISLIDKASEEIDIYRKRQITTFREMSIVIGVICWSVVEMEIESVLYANIIAITASLACIAATSFGVWIIMAYKYRIYHIRTRRDEIMSNISSIKDIYFPIINKKVMYNNGIKRTIGDYDKIRYKKSKQTSFIYSLALLAVGLLGVVITFFSKIQFPLLSTASNF